MAGVLKNYIVGAARWMKRRWRWLILLAATLLVMVWAAYLRFARGQPWAAWTGFEGKTLWDWMQLLVIPGVLAIGAYLFNRAERQAERETQLDRVRETALQAYLDQMTQLMIGNELRKSNINDEVRVIARVRTLTVLDQLDELRKAVVLKFLYEANLIDKGAPVVNLSGADFSGLILNKGIFLGVDLSEVNLRKAKLLSLGFPEVKLTGADMTGAVLIEVNLHGADLRGVRFVGATLIMVNLGGADIRGAVLRGIGPDVLTLADAQRRPFVSATLTMVNVRGAKYNIKTIWPEGFNPANNGAIAVSENI